MFAFPIFSAPCRGHFQLHFRDFFRVPPLLPWALPRNLLRNLLRNLPVSLGFLEAEGAEREVEDGEEGAADARAEEARAPEDQTARVEDRRGVR